MGVDFAVEASSVRGVREGSARGCLAAPGRLPHVHRRASAEATPAASLTETVPAAADAGARLDVRQGMRALDPQDRAVVLLVDLLGFDYETAARVTGVPRGTLAWRLSVARGRFREAIGDGGSETE
jgi:DNA-directed RNA polymerase specialized sigma24 family protein